MVITHYNYKFPRQEDRVGLLGTSAGIKDAYLDMVYRSSTDGLDWPLPNLSIIPRHNVSAIGGNARGHVGDVPNVVIPCSAAMGIWHEPEDVDCPFKAFGQFNGNALGPWDRLPGTLGPHATCGTSCSSDGIYWPMIIVDGEVHADVRMGNYALSDETSHANSRSCDDPTDPSEGRGDPPSCQRSRCDTHQSGTRLANGSWLGTTRTRMRHDLGRTEAVVLSDNFEDWKDLFELEKLGQEVRNTTGILGRGGPWPAGGDDIDSMVAFKPPMLPGHTLVSESADFLLSFVSVHRVSCPHSQPPRNHSTCYEAQLAMSTDPIDPESWRMVFPPAVRALGFIPLGEPGSYDSNYVGAATKPFLHPNRSRIQLYYLANTMGDVLPEPVIRDYDSIALAELGVDGWAGYSGDNTSVSTTRHAAEGDELTLVLGCNHNLGCGNVSVTVLDGTTAKPLGPRSLPVRPIAGAFSAPVDVRWSGPSGLARGKSVVLRICIAGNAAVYSFTYGLGRTGPR
eukprot:SAG31_NODE_1866_length_7025_cov_2.554017_7_plen_510_part_00